MISRITILIILLPVLIWPVEVSSSISILNTGQSKYRNPIGLDISVIYPVSARLSFGGSISRSWSSHTYVDYLHGGFINPAEQSKVELQLKSKFTNIEVQVRYKVLEFQLFELSAFSGLGYWLLSGEKEATESGETAIVAKSMKGGFSPGMELVLPRLLNENLVIFATYSREINFMMSMVTDSDAPYQVPFSLQVLNVGMRYRLN